MKVIKANVLGFCMGVQRAVNLALAEANKAGGDSVYTLGPLIHNPKVLDDLKAHGVRAIDEAMLENNCSLPAANCSLIIRAHGITPALERKLFDKGCRIVDATCPHVKANQLKAEELSREGYCLFIAGEADHAEVESIKGYASAACAGNDGVQVCTVVGNTDEALRAAVNLYKINNDAKTALLGQTTISMEEYAKIGEKIYTYFPNLEIIQTICDATSERQEALRELLTKVDAVVIAGGKESANTRRLLVIAQESGKPCVLAENAACVPKEFFNYAVVGLCAGASTPDSVIEEIEQLLAD